MTEIRPISADDHAAWLPLWEAYLKFYEADLPDEVTADVFERLTADADLHGAIAWDQDGTALGLVHWLFHPSTWSRSRYCYLEDLYVSPAARGLGVGAGLIAHVESQARSAGAEKVYWLTHETNATAQSLYDRVASRTGFTHYEISARPS